MSLHNLWLIGTKGTRNIVISIVLPIFNIKKEELRDCFDSLQKQTLKDFEVLMVDDGSRPYVQEFCKSYASQDTRFLYLAQTHSGVCAARNRGLDAAKGEYTCFVDPDDWVSERYLEALYGMMEKTGADISIVDCQLHYKNRTVENHFLNIQETALQGKDKNCLLYQLFSRKLCDYYPPELPAGTAWAKMFRTAFLKEKGLRFLKGLTRMEDILFCMYAYEEANHIAYRQESLYHYRVSEKSVSHCYDPDIVRNFEIFFYESKQYLDHYQKGELLYHALAMRELTAVHSYLRLYYFRNPELTRRRANQEIDLLLAREPYYSAMKQIDRALLSRQEYVFVKALQHRHYNLLRALIRARELIKN